MVINSPPDARHIVQLIWCSCQSLLVHIIIGPFHRRGNWGTVLLSWKVKLFAQDYTDRHLTLVPKCTLLTVLSHLVLRAVALTWTGRKTMSYHLQTQSWASLASFLKYLQPSHGAWSKDILAMFLSWGFQIWLLITTTQRALRNYRFSGPWALGKIQTKQTQGGTWKSAFSQGPCGSANCQHRPDPQVLSVLGTIHIKLSGLLVPSSLCRDFLPCDNWVLLPEACSGGFHSR